jgi:hypothetical protein
VKEATDRRRHPRFDTHVSVKYNKLRDGSGAHGTGSITRDISEGGTCFRTDGFVPMAHRLILEMQVPGRRKAVKAISKVSWIRKTDSGSDFETGSQFLEMSKEDRDVLSEYINTLG